MPKVDPVEERVPVTTPLPLEVLDPEIRVPLVNLLPTSKSEKEKYQFVSALYEFQKSAEEKAKKDILTVGTYYGGELTISPFVDRVGAYNPQRYPLEILDKMRRNPQISSGLRTIMGVIQGLRWSIDCADPIQKHFLEWAVKKIYVKALRSLSMALIWGFSSNRLLWAHEPVNLQTVDYKGTTQRKRTIFRRKAYYVRNIIDHYPNTVRVLLHPTTGEFLGIVQTQPVSGKEEIVENGFKLMFAGFDQEHGNWFGRSLLINAYMPWYWSEVFTHFQARYLERRGIPPTVVSYPTGWSDIEGQGNVRNSKLAVMLGTALLENSVVALPSDLNDQGKNKWGLDFLSDDRRADMFTAVLNRLDVLMSRGLGVPDRAVNQDLAPGGTSSGSESSRDLLMLIVGAYINQMEYHFQTDIVDAIHKLNFKKEERYEATFSFQPPAFDRMRVAKELWVEEIRQTPNWLNKGMRPRWGINVPEFSRMLAMPIEEIDENYEEDERLKPEPPPPTQPPTPEPDDTPEPELPDPEEVE